MRDVEEKSKEGPKKSVRSPEYDEIVGRRENMATFELAANRLAGFLKNELGNCLVEKYGAKEFLDAFIASSHKTFDEIFRRLEPNAVTRSEVMNEWSKQDSRVQEKADIVRGNPALGYEGAIGMFRSDLESLLQSSGGDARGFQTEVARFASKKRAEILTDAEGFFEEIAQRMEERTKAIQRRHQIGISLHHEMHELGTGSVDDSEKLEDAMAYEIKEANQEDETLASKFRQLIARTQIVRKAA